MIIRSVRAILRKAKRPMEFNRYTPCNRADYFSENRELLQEQLLRVFREESK